MDLVEDYIKPKYRFRDPIYGFIEVNDSELRIIDTPIFQRLRRVHQLALTKYVYPTAEHSRFTHSLGVLQMATNIFLNLYKNSKEIFLKIMGNEENIARHLQIVRFAALLHDIGHTPFSHASEKTILGDNITHEMLGKYIIENYFPIRDAIVENDILPSEVGSILHGNLTAEFRILKNIISGHLDADRADYLLRDSYSCGVKYGEYDFNRFFRAFYLKEDNEGINLCIKEEDIYLIESFLLARYHYNLQVPFHRTRVGYDIVLKKYMGTLKEKNIISSFLRLNESNDTIIEMDFDAFTMFDDYTIFENIKKDYSDNQNKWARMLLRQEHLVPVFDHLKTKESEFDFKKIIVELGKNSNFRKEHDFFIYRNKKEVSNLVADNNSSSKALNIIFKDRKELYSISELPNILIRLTEPIEIIRIYTFEDKKLEIAKVCEKVIKENEEIRKVKE